MSIRCFVLFFCTVNSLVLISYSHQLQTNITSKKEVIYILTLLPYYDPDPSVNPSWNEGDNVQPAINFAVDQINNSTSLLENYTIQLIHTKSGCNLVVKTTISYVEHVSTDISGILGPACSSSAVTIGSLNSRPDIGIAVVHGSGSPVLADRKRFPYFLGTLGSDRDLLTGLLDLVDQAGWERLAVLFDNSNVVFKNTKKLLVGKLSRNITIQFESPVTDTFIPLRPIRDQRLRVIVVLGNTDLIQRVVCRAHMEGMFFDNYQWVFMGRAFDEISQPIQFVYDRVQHYCSGENMVETLEKAFFIVYNLMQSNVNATLVSNITYDQYLEGYEEYRNIHNQRPGLLRNSSYTYWAAYFYDSMWAWALVLDNLTRSSSDFEINGGYFGSTSQTSATVEQFYKTSFQGVSGEIHFDSRTGYNQRKANISQVKDGQLRSIEEATPVFIEDSFPYFTINRGLAGFLVFITSLQFLMTLILQVMSIAYHRYPSLKATSQKFLHMSYFGVYLWLIGTFIWTLNPAADFYPLLRNKFCIVLWAWCIPIGCTLAYVPVGVRTFRLYRIFEHYMNPGPFISEHFLIGVISVCLLIDLAFGIAWTVVDPFYIVRDLEFSEGTTVVVSVTISCSCNYIFIWLAIILFYKLLVQFLVVLIFAHLTRNITMGSFTTKALRVFVYVQAVIMLIGFPIYFVLIFFQINQYSYFITLSLLLNMLIFVFIVFIFVPPLSPILTNNIMKKNRRYNYVSRSSVSSMKSL